MQICEKFTYLQNLESSFFYGKNDFRKNEKMINWTYLVGGD